jgi:hypothetical protein
MIGVIWFLAIETQVVEMTVMKDRYGEPERGGGE